MLAAAAVTASYIPSRRATAVNPAGALRSESGYFTSTSSIAMRSGPSIIAARIDPQG